MQWKRIFWGLIHCFLSGVLWIACKNNTQVIFKASRANEAPIIDGKGIDKCWQKANWYPINQVWMGQKPESGDFEGRFKVVWTVEKLYILFEIKDEKLSLIHTDHQKAYNQDDCIIVFIDEDHSSGNYQFNHNAFAYHISQDYQVLNYDTHKKIGAYQNHVQMKRTKTQNIYTWEMAFLIYNDTYKEDKSENQLVRLKLGKKMGLVVAYADTDNDEKRDNYIGSVALRPSQQTQIWQDAGIFGVLELVE